MEPSGKAEAVNSVYGGPSSALFPPSGFDVEVEFKPEEENGEERISSSKIGWGGCLTMFLFFFVYVPLCFFFSLRVVIAFCLSDDLWLIFRSIEMNGSVSTLLML